MKVKFTKLAALLLAGVALFATGCTDYEVDIQKVDQKVDDLENGKVASLQNQLNTLEATLKRDYETIENHNKDVQALRGEMGTLETTLKGLIDKKLDKSTYEEFQASIAAAKETISGLKYADKDFVNQVAGLLNDLSALTAGDWTTKAGVKYATIQEYINGEITRLERRIEANEKALDDLTKEGGIIDQIKARIKELEDLNIKQRLEDLENGKLDRAEFDEYFKKAYEKNVALIKQNIEALVALTAGFPEDKTIKEYIDAADQALQDDITTKYLDVVSKAFGTEQKMKDMQGTLLGRLEACESLLEGDWGGKTVQEYIDAEAKKLQGQIDDINNVQLPAIRKRLDDLEESVNEVILPQIKFALDYESEYFEGATGLQAYIDDQALNAFLASVAYTDSAIADLAMFLMDFICPLQERIQSIVYVPDYEDLKITTNMAYVSQTVVPQLDGVAGNPVVQVAVMDEPTKITYKILPAQFASWAASNYEDIFAFDVKAVKTRADGDEDEKLPAFEILSVDYDEATVDETGLLTFTVLPVNVASESFAAAGLTPLYNVNLRAGGIPGVLDGDHVWGTDHELRGYFGDERNAEWNIPIWKAEDLENYQARTAFAASLRLKLEEGPNMADYWFTLNYGEDVDPDEAWDACTEEYAEYNEVASTYNVLYPGVTDIEILPDPYRPELDENGDPKKDEEGDVILNPVEDEVQNLPYSALRKDGDAAIGELEDQDPKGYRVILDQVVPGVEINGKVYTVEDAARHGYIVPTIELSFNEFTYDKGTAVEDLDENNFIETAKVYAEFEMNPDVDSATRKLAVGNVITGWYNLTSIIGTTPFSGDVVITRPLGKVSVSANIKWNYAEDADVDHALYYDEAPTVSYSHNDVAIVVDETSAATLASQLGIGVADFSGKTPDSVVIKDGEDEVTITISDVTINEDGSITADFADFAWGKTYSVTAVYTLDAAVVTVEGTLTTVDRKRDLMVVNLPEKAFILNGEDYNADSDTYSAGPEEFQQDLFDLFVENGIINAGTPLDFEDADAFIGLSDQSGKEGHLVVVTEDNLDEGEANSSNIVIADDNASFSATSPELKAIFDAGEAQVIYVTTYIGQKVKIVWPVTVDLPKWDFLHLSYYTFNTDKENGSFIQKFNFDDNDGSVKWWTKVQPTYRTSRKPNDDNSNRHCLYRYDVSYINLAELAFNVVDENDEPMDDETIEENSLVVNFAYTDAEQGEKELPVVDQMTNLNLYEDLWMDNTVFYYRTNEKLFIPMKGELGIMSGDTYFPLPTRFNTPKAAVKFPEEVLDYSTYALVPWKPFQEPKAEGYTIVLDENIIYRVPLFKGMELKDNRPQGVSYFVIEDGEWVEGNVADLDAGATEEGNGYRNITNSRDAYGITTRFTYDDLDLPQELRKLLSIQFYDAQRQDYFNEQNREGTRIPYVVYDYTSQVEFRGKITIPVVVSLENPWQKTLKFKYNLVIQGADQPAEGNGE